jgi:hypothetical protein
MTALLVCGQDIRSLSLGLVVDGRLERESLAAVPPERYLACVAETLAEWNTDVSDLGAVAVVSGPGSFTSSRVSTTIANAIAFARNIPVVAVENPERGDMRSLVAAIDLSVAPVSGRFAVPVYDRPPHVT